LVEKFALDTEADRVLNDWPNFVERMAATALRDCKDTASLCFIIYRDPFFHTRFSEIRCSARISLTIPLSTLQHGQREFFSPQMDQNPHPNRLSNETLSAHFNISINHGLVGDAELKLVTQKWLGRKERRTLSKRAIKQPRTLESRRV